MDDLTRKSRLAAASWLQALRLPFRPLSWAGYTLGAVAAPGTLSLSDYMLGYVALFLVETATVLTNEYYDYESDRINVNHSAYSGGSRVLVERRLTFTQIRVTAVLAAAAGIATGLVAIGVSSGAPLSLLITLAFATLLSLGYSLPPLRFAWRGLGELTVAGVHGIGVVCWGWLLQGGGIDDATLWRFAIPLSCAILPAILLAGVPDRAADADAGKLTLAARWGIGVTITAAVVTVWTAVLSMLFWPNAVREMVVIVTGAMVHAAVLTLLVARYSRHAAGRPAATTRIDRLLQIALAFIAWFSIAPLIGMVLE